MTGVAVLSEAVISMRSEAQQAALRHLARKSAQAQVIERKQERVLQWLADEVFTSQRVLQDVLGLQRNAVRKTVDAMLKARLVDVHEVSYLDFSFRVVVLTPHGAALAGRPGEHFEQGRIAESSIAHALDLQRVRVQLEQQGWTGWKAERALRKLAEAEVRSKVPDDERLWPKVPDAVAVAPKSGLTVAIEIERTIKTLKTYELIVGAYSLMFERQAVSQVLYLTRTDREAKALEMTFDRIKDVVVPEGKKRVRYEFEQGDRERFSFKSLAVLLNQAGQAAHAQGEQ